MVLKSGCKMFAVVTAPALNSSALKRLAGALWFLRELMAAVISSFFYGAVSTLRSSSVSGISGSSSGAGLLRPSLKCSTQHASWSFSKVRSCPCLSRMGTCLLPLYFPQSDQLNDFCIPLFSLLCHFSAFFASLSI